MQAVWQKFTQVARALRNLADERGAGSMGQNPYRWRNSEAQGWKGDGILGRASTGDFVFNSVGNGKLMERFNQKLCPD